MNPTKVSTPPYSKEALKTFYRMILISQGFTSNISSASTLEEIVDKDPELKNHVKEITEDNKAKKGIFYWEVLRYIGEVRRELEKGEPKVQDLLRSSTAKSGDYSQPEETHK